MRVLKTLLLVFVLALLVFVLLDTCEANDFGNKSEDIVQIEDAGPFVEVFVNGERRYTIDKTTGHITVLRDRLTVISYTRLLYGPDFQVNVINGKGFVVD